MFNYDNVHVQTVVLSDPTADTTSPIFRVPSRNTKIEILEAWAASDTTITGVGGTGFSLRLLDYGTAGTAVGGTITATLGGTTSTWTANTPRTFTVSEGTLDANDYVMVYYDETGTIAPLNITVGFSWVSGVGA